MKTDLQKVFDKIDADELAKLVLDMAKIASPTGSDGAVAVRRISRRVGELAARRTQYLECTCWKNSGVSFRARK
jgi:hypothetical protein